MRQKVDFPALPANIPLSDVTKLKQTNPEERKQENSWIYRQQWGKWAWSSFSVYFDFQPRYFFFKELILFRLVSDAVSNKKKICYILIHTCTVCCVHFWSCVSTHSIKTQDYFFKDLILGDCLFSIFHATFCIQYHVSSIKQHLSNNSWLMTFGRDEVRLQHKTVSLLLTYSLHNYVLPCIYHLSFSLHYNMLLCDKQFILLTLANWGSSWCLEGSLCSSRLSECLWTKKENIIADDFHPKHSWRCSVGM